MCLPIINAGLEMNSGQVACMGQELRKQLTDVPDDPTIGIPSHARPPVAAAFITRGSFKIGPAAISAALTHHPPIADAETMGQPYARLGQVPVSAIVLRQSHKSLAKADLFAFLLERLLAYETPVVIQAIEQIPCNKMKLDKPAFVALFDLRWLQRENWTVDENMLKIIGQLCRN
jgi:acyl-CoA synthetase (AMP-forming)/AMP-acid ligase II